MKVASVSEAKSTLSSLIAQAKAGETVLIADRGVPVVRIEAVRAADDGSPRRLRLERAGMIRPGAGGARRALEGEPARTRTRGARSAVDALIEERRSGR